MSTHDGTGVGPRGGDPLAAAQDELARRVRAADATGDPHGRLLWEHLEEVADYLRRIALPETSAHYRADKSSELLRAAVRLKATALEDYGGWPDDGPALRAIVDPQRILERVNTATGSVMWSAAEAASFGNDQVGVEQWRAAEIQQIAREFTAWAAEVASRAVPDGEDV